MSCSSLIRWLDTSTARPSAASDAQEPAHPDDALGVHAVERLVQHQHRRVAEQRRGDARAAAACPASTRPPCGGPPCPARPARSPRRPGARPDPGSGPATAGGCGPCGWAAARRRPAATRRGSAGAAGDRYGRPPTSAVPSSAASRPRITRIVVDLPAPLGPTNPVTWPGRTVNDIPSSATAGPNRLRRPLTSIVASIPGRLGNQGGLGRHARERSSPSLARGCARPLIPRRGDSAVPGQGDASVPASGDNGLHGDSGSAGAPDGRAAGGGSRRPGTRRSSPRHCWG